MYISIYLADYISLFVHHVIIYLKIHILLIMININIDKKVNYLKIEAFILYIISRRINIYIIYRLKQFTSYKVSGNTHKITLL